MAIDRYSTSCIVRLETRGRECIYVVTRKGERKQKPAALWCERCGMKVPLITCIQPETKRSNPKQDEVSLLRDGGPLEVLGSIRSRDFGIEVKC